ncbi:phosphoglycerate mutase-like protein [Hypoxylon trugodes]|uniref:phosphoglycerate mutase-like protein n=1 Tax=Hypoxylon trugodes TaxID=326681 RepID=UPI002199485C|nr:phosphoglycerate mutase-like protein [Hypoxylon trugodes]KAI1391601.1 phosphoglycerate mutase-like protein [Hypoxylon trugodes]
MKRLIRRLTHPQSDKVIQKGATTEKAAQNAPDTMLETPPQQDRNTMADSSAAFQNREANTSTSSHTHDMIYKYSYVPDFFKNYADIADSSLNGKVSTQPALGILEKEYDGESANPTTNGERAQQWVRFTNYIQELNRRHINDGTSYKLLYIIRHGQGIHNVKMDELKVAEEAGTLEIIDGKPLNWKNYWSHEDGDGKVIWADAQLVDKGIRQAQDLAKLWIDEAQKDALPLPGTVYTSPLARCLETTRLAYTPVMARHGRRLQAVIKENLRERITDHTCDRRSTRSWIERNYPDYTIEEGFSEEDKSWDVTKSESLEQHVVRIQRLFDEIFSNDASPIISLTTHSYALTAILALVGYPKFLVNEGTIVPLFIKAEKVTQNTPPS